MAAVETKPKTDPSTTFSPLQYSINQIEQLKKTFKEFEEKGNQYIGAGSSLERPLARKLFERAMFARWKDLIATGLSEEKANALTGRTNNQIEILDGRQKIKKSKESGVLFQADELLARP